MPGIIGKKIGMTSIFTEEGKNVPCTVLEAGPCIVTQIKTVEHDGYNAIQLAFDEKKEKNTSDPLKGHFKKAGTSPKRKLVEFRDYDTSAYKLGDVVTLVEKAQAEIVQKCKDLEAAGKVFIARGGEGDAMV